MASAGSGLVTPRVANDLARTEWYAAYTKHQHEKQVAQQFTRKGLEAFLPLYESARRWQDRTKNVQLPLFPCYVFVRMNLRSKLDVLATRGVFWLVGSRGFASAVPECEIGALRTLVAGSTRVEPHPYLTQGERVRVRSGPLAGIEGIFVRSKGRCRVVLSVPLLMQSAAVEVEVSLLERIPAGKMTVERTNPEECHCGAR